jgi:hypothetical protein
VPCPSCFRSRFSRQAGVYCACFVVPHLPHSAGVMVAPHTLLRWSVFTACRSRGFGERGRVSPEFRSPCLLMNTAGVRLDASCGSVPFITLTPQARDSLTIVSMRVGADPPLPVGECRALRSVSAECSLSKHAHPATSGFQSTLRGPTSAKGAQRSYFGGTHRSFRKSAAQLRVSVNRLPYPYLLAPTAGRRLLCPTRAPLPGVSVVQQHRSNGVMNYSQHQPP